MNHHGSQPRIASLSLALSKTLKSSIGKRNSLILSKSTEKRSIGKEKYLRKSTSPKWPKRKREPSKRSSTRKVHTLTFLKTLSLFPFQWSIPITIFSEWTFTNRPRTIPFKISAWSIWTKKTSLKNQWCLPIVTNHLWRELKFMNLKKSWTKEFVWTITITI